MRARASNTRRFRNSGVILCAVIGFLFIGAAMLPAQSIVKIKGRVTDAQTGLPLAGANVRIADHAVGTVSDDRGRFALENLPDGAYSLRISYMGYESVSREVRVDESAPVQLYVELQPTFLDLQEISISAARFGSTETPGNEIILTRHELETMAATTVGDALRQLPGIEVQSTGGPAARQTVSIRGSRANQVVVLLDGVKLNDALSGAADLADIPLQNIETVTIRKGTTAEHRGAIGGVIDIRTRSQTENHLGIQTRVGSFGFISIAPTAAFRNSHFSATLTYQAVRGEGNYHYSYQTPDARTEHERRQNADMNSQNWFSTVQFESGAHQVSVRLQSFIADRGMPGKIQYWTGHARSHSERRQAQAQYRWRHGLWSAQAAANAAVYETRDANLWPDNAAIRDRVYPRYHFQNRLETRSGQLLVQRMSQHLDLSMGGDIEQRQFRNDNLLYPAAPALGQAKDQNQAIFFKAAAENRLGPLLWRNRAILRYDAMHMRAGDETRTEQQFSPGLHTTVSLGSEPSVYLTAGWSRSFRAPTFADLFYNDVRVQGRPDLRPEKSENVEYGGGLQWRGLSLSQSFYRYSVKDMIVWRLGSFEVFRPYNSDARVIGSESLASLDMFSQKLRFQASYDHIRALNKTPNETLFNMLLPYRPEHSIKAGITARLGKIQAAADYRYVGRRYLTEANTQWLPPYRVLDARLQWQTEWRRFSIRWQAAVFNLLNEEYEILRDMPLPGREWRLGISLDYH